MSGYFSYFPNVYVGEGVTDDEAFKYRLVKNIFRKVRARPDLDQYTTLFEQYSIRVGETPSTLAQRLFGDPKLDWALLLINDIIDVYEDWPKEQSQLEEFVDEKYTSEKRDDIHHWETNEVILDDGTPVIKEGVQVTEDWRTVLPNGDVKDKETSIYQVTNYEHEYFKNELKRQILIPVRNMLDIMIEEFEDLVAYEPHNELDSSNNKKTVLNISSRFLNNTGSVSFASAVRSVANGQTEITYDDGPGNVGGTNTLSLTAGVSRAVSTTNTCTTNTSSRSSSSSSSSSSGSSGGY